MAKYSTSSGIATMKTLGANHITMNDASISTKLTRSKDM
jgi:hypothetical protein